MATKSDSRKIAGLDRAALLKAHRAMSLSRLIDEAEVKLKRLQKAYFHISCAGHEAVQAAAGLVLRSGYDWFYPYYRDRVLALELGVSPYEILLQTMAKASDPSSGGREMPCHFGSPSLHIVNQSSPTGTQYPQAVGTAEAGRLAQRLVEDGLPQRPAGSSRQPASGRDLALPEFKADEVVYVSGGEGSTSEGEFYEAICAASLRKLPVLFLIQDNEYAISVPAEFQTPGGSISALVRGFPGFFVAETNGLDVLESYETLRRAVAYVRAGEGPALVHAHVVRLKPHSDSDDDRAYRPPHEKSADAVRDPVPAFEEFLLQDGWLQMEELQELHRGYRAEVDEAVRRAVLEADPAPSTVERHLYNPSPIEVVEPDAPPEGQPLTLLEAIQRTLEVEMARDPRIVVFGEDVADVSRLENASQVPGKGGVFKATHKLQRSFGPERVFNAPIAEAAIVGRAFGMAVRGMVPVVEVQFFDYIWPAMHQIRNELSILRWRSNNTFSAPVVLRVPMGGYLAGGGIYHSQCGESIFCHCPGLRVVLPSNARDAVGLLRAAVRCGDPVLFLEHKHLYRQPYARSPDPGEDYIVPLGKARVAREGTDVSVITYGALVQKSLQAAQEVESRGIRAEVLDLRSLAPYDWPAIARSVRKTSRVVVAYEDNRSHGFGAEIAARISEELFSSLDAPVTRVAGRDTPVGYSPVLERATLPHVEDLVAAIERVRRY